MWTYTTESHDSLLWRTRIYIFMNSFRSATDPLGTASAYNCRRSPHKSILSERAISFMKNEFEGEWKHHNFRFSGNWNVFPFLLFAGIPGEGERGSALAADITKVAFMKRLSGINATVKCFPASTDTDTLVQIRSAGHRKPLLLGILWQPSGKG